MTTCTACLSPIVCGLQGCAHATHLRRIRQEAGLPTTPPTVTANPDFARARFDASNGPPGCGAEGVSTTAPALSDYERYVWEVLVNHNLSPTTTRLRSIAAALSRYEDA